MPTPFRRRVAPCVALSHRSRALSRRLEGPFPLQHMRRLPRWCDGHSIHTLKLSAVSALLSPLHVRDGCWMCNRGWLAPANPSALAAPGAQCQVVVSDQYVSNLSRDHLRLCHRFRYDELIWRASVCLSPAIIPLIQTHLAEEPRLIPISIFQEDTISSAYRPFTSKQSSA